VPAVAVTVMTYVPAVVPGLVVVPVILLPPPHAVIPPPTDISKKTKPRTVLHLRRRPGIPKRRMQAKAAPPAEYQGAWLFCGYARELVVAAVVEMVRVAVAAVVPLMLTGVVVPKLNVGRFTAPDGLVVIAAVNATLPVRPPAGVTLIVEVLPVVAPGAMATAVPLTVKPAGAETITEVVPDPVA